MPWTADEMRAKGCKGDCAKAARQANHILETCRARGGGSECERIAITTALKDAKTPQLRRVGAQT